MFFLTTFLDESFINLRHRYSIKLLQHHNNVKNNSIFIRSYPETFTYKTIYVKYVYVKYISQLALEYIGNNES